MTANQTEPETVRSPIAQSRSGRERCPNLRRKDRRAIGQPFHQYHIVRYCRRSNRGFFLRTVSVDAAISVDLAQTALELRHFHPPTSAFRSNNVEADVQRIAYCETDNILKNHPHIASIEHLGEAPNDTVNFQDKLRDWQDTSLRNSHFLRICVGQAGTDSHPKLTI
jgi:hypothetical protein